MNQKVIPFLLGLAFGCFGVRWFTHLIYLGLIASSFFAGRHFA
jgi:hypothetical protein